MRILPPHVFYPLAGLTLAGHLLWPEPRWTPPGPAAPLIGLGLMAASVALAVWAKGMVTAEGTAIKPHHPPSKLLTRGPFRHSRNPMYLGMAAFLAGLALALGSTPALAAPVIMFLVLRLGYIPMEEKNLRQAFGAAYAAYAKRTRRWL